MRRVWFSFELYMITQAANKEMERVVFKNSIFATYAQRTKYLGQRTLYTQSV